LRGICHGLLGHPDDERRCFEAVLEGPEPKDAGTVAFALYRTGQLEEAAQRYGALAEDLHLSARHHMYELDLGQVLLLRGDRVRDDVNTGIQLIRSGIAGINHVDDLIDLVAIEFPHLRDAVRDSPHGGDVNQALSSMERLAHDRSGELRQRVRSESELSVALARARTALSTGDIHDAVQRYAKIVLADIVPEASRGLANAALRQLDAADAVLRGGDLGTARAMWGDLATVGHLLPEPLASTLANRLKARLALASLEQEGVVESTTLNFVGAETSSLKEALPLFARSVSTAWAHYDGLQAPALYEPDRSIELQDVAAELLFDQVYGLRRAAASNRASTPAVNAIELFLDAGNADLASAKALRQGPSALRRRLTEELGVRIPGVRVDIKADLPPNTAHVMVYDQLAATIDIMVGSRDPAGGILDQFEQVLRDNMFRWLSYDDVELWAAGWQLDVPVLRQPKSGELPSDPWMRLHLVKLLRMLLREGVSVANRDTILAGLREAEDLELSQVEILNFVRRLLYPATLGPDPSASVWTVPDELQQRLGGGLLSDGTGVWEVDRPTARALLDDLRRWRHDAVPPGPTVLGVTEPATRLVLARLLASDRPRVYVTAKNEQP
jgi:hypothetical protein